MSGDAGTVCIAAAATGTGSVAACFVVPAARVWHVGRDVRDRIRAADAEAFLVHTEALQFFGASRRSGTSTCAGGSFWQPGRSAGSRRWPVGEQLGALACHAFRFGDRLPVGLDRIAVIGGGRKPDP